MRRKQQDIVGHQFGRLYVIEPTDNRENNNIVYRCRCTNCGKELLLNSGTITAGKQVSCGCIRAEKSKENLNTKPAAEKLGLVEGTNVSRIRSKNLQKNNKTGVRGVSLDKSGHYVAYIYFQGRRYHLYFGPDFDKAVSARKEAEQSLFGNFLEWYNAVHPNQK